MILTKILSQLDVVCYTTTSASEGLRMAQEIQPKIAILDLIMPEMSGWEVLERLRAETTQEDMHVIIVTAKDSSLEPTLAANIARVDGFLTKPVSATEVLHCVQDLLGKKPNPIEKGNGAVAASIREADSA